MSKRGMAIITAALMLWVAAVPAFAADVPYPDVAPDHWAYEAIASLHKAGLVEGYPDGSFGGERTFTRYEMAMVFNRILQRLDGRLDLLAGTGVDVDALMDEFGNELDLINALTVAIANAQETADGAAQQAYRARLTATQALEQVGNVEDAAQRGQRIAADAEAAAMRATAIAERAYLTAEEAQQSAINAAKLAVEARGTGDAEGALAQANRATDVAMQADRLAYLARLDAERAVELAEDAHARLDALATLGGELKAEYVTVNDGEFNIHVNVNATAQPTDNLTVVGGVELAQNLLDVAEETFHQKKVYAKVQAPGLLREVAFEKGIGAHEVSLTVGLPVSAFDTKVTGAYGRLGAEPYISVGVAVDDIAVSEAVALNAGFKYTTYPDADDDAMSVRVGAEMDALGGRVDLGLSHVFDGGTEISGGLAYPFTDVLEGTLRGTYTTDGTDSDTTVSSGLGLKF